jgi:hypothetical protein
MLCCQVEAQRYFYILPDGGCEILMRAGSSVTFHS